MASTPLASHDKPPAWLRLTRVKNTITAYTATAGAPDGWTQVGQPQERRTGRIACDPEDLAWLVDHTVNECASPGRISSLVAPVPQ